MEQSRVLYNTLLANISKQKVSILLGARRVGKTYLLQQIKNSTQNCLWLNGEDEIVAASLEERTVANYKRLLQGYRLLVIDEAQYIKDIGRKVKLMIDEIKPLHIIITGSSAFDLQQASGEPLTGRSITYTMFPVAQMELSQHENSIETRGHLDERLVFGSYPEVITLPTLAEKKQYLFELMNTYLLKDILAFENIRNPQKLKDLLVLLAHQVGHEVSLDELGRQLAMSKNTVERYLDLLTKVFVIYKRSGFSRNLRKEVTKNHRWYFYDNGIRNALINNFNLPALRPDMGLLWENYIAGERIKYNAYNNRIVNSYFWRTYDQQEIDLVEEENAAISAYEFKWRIEKAKTPVAFAKAYPGVAFTVVHSGRYMDFIV